MSRLRVLPQAAVHSKRIALLFRRRMGQMMWNTEMLAKEMEVSRPAVSRDVSDMTRRPRNFTISTILQYCRALKLGFTPVFYAGDFDRPVDGRVFTTLWQAAGRPQTVEEISMMTRTARPVVVVAKPGKSVSFKDAIDAEISRQISAQSGIVPPEVAKNDEVEE